MEIKDNRGIGGRLSQMLKVYGLSVNALASEIGGTTAKYYKLLNGKSKPDFETIFAILDKFPEISAEWLMRGSGPMRKGELISTEEANQIITENKLMQKLYARALSENAQSVGKDKGDTKSSNRSKRVNMMAVPYMNSVTGLQTAKVIVSSQSRFCAEA
ncbi:helix-turn-helix domain-containing protein [Pedobacter sp.]|uniref:helix-turn-helix domain-containing protein n=1 Tax=Pedobacter sp. TaxID=1411316 RepID=UPI003C49A480